MLSLHAAPRLAHRTKEADCAATTAVLARLILCQVQVHAPGCRCVDASAEPLAGSIPAPGKDGDIREVWMDGNFAGSLLEFRRGVLRHKSSPATGPNPAAIDHSERTHSQRTRAANSAATFVGKRPDYPRSRINRPRELFVRRNGRASSASASSDCSGSPDCRTAAGSGPRFKQ